MNEQKKPVFPVPPRVGDAWWDPKDPDVGTAEKVEQSQLSGEQTVRVQLRIERRNGHDVIADVRCNVACKGETSEVMTLFASELYASDQRGRTARSLWATGSAHPAAHAALADWAKKMEGREEALSLENEPLLQHLKKTFSTR